MKPNIETLNIMNEAVFEKYGFEDDRVNRHICVLCGSPCSIGTSFSAQGHNLICSNCFKEEYDGSLKKMWRGMGYGSDKEQIERDKMKVWLLYKTNEFNSEIPLAFSSKKKMQKHAVNYIREYFDIYNKSKYWTAEEDINLFLEYNNSDLCWACKVKIDK